MTEKACVYDIVFRGKVIYVGMTGNPDRRFKQHKSSGVAPKGSKMLIVEWHESRADAFAAELTRQRKILPGMLRNKGVSKSAVSFRLTETCRDLIKSHSKKENVSQASFLERVITEEYRRHFRKK